MFIISYCIILIVLYLYLLYKVRHLKEYKFITKTIYIALFFILLTIAIISMPLILFFIILIIIRISLVNMVKKKRKENNEKN